MLAEGTVPCNRDQKFVHILKKTGRDWRKRIFISTLYSDECDEVQLDQVETRSVKVGMGFKDGKCLSLIVLYFTASTLSRERQMYLILFRVCSNCRVNRDKSLGTIQGRGIWKRQRRSTENS
jgi:hypothetical protein